MHESIIDSSKSLYLLPVLSGHFMKSVTMVTTFSLWLTVNERYPLKHFSSKLHRSLTNCYRPRTKYEGRHCFHRCLSVHISGGGGVTPSSWWGEGGYPIPGLDRGRVPHPRSRQGVPVPGPERAPHPANGRYPIPAQVGGGVPHPADGGYPITGPGRGVPQGTPLQDWLG